MDRTQEKAGIQTTASLQRAPGFCWLQDFLYQTNEHLFQCRLAVELLLLLKPPPKYHSFHKTCAAASEELRAFQPLCPRFGQPQSECSILRDSSALFSSIHEVSVVAQSITHWDHGSGRCCHSLGIEQWLTGVTKRRSCSSHRAAACVEESKVSHRGAVRKGLTQCMLRRGRKEETTPAIYFSPSSTIYTSLWETSLSAIEFLRLRSDFTHTHTPGRPLLVPQQHPWLVCFLKWLILSPFPKGGRAWAQLPVRLFCLAEMRGRKEKGVSCFLPFAFKVSQPDYCSSSSEEKTEFIAFVSQLAQFSCFFQCHRTPLMNTNTLSSQRTGES